MFLHLFVGGEGFQESLQISTAKNKWLCEKRSLLPCFRQMGKANPAFMAFSIGLGDSGLKKGRGVAASTYQGRGGGSWGYKSQICYHYMGRSLNGGTANPPF